MCTDNNQGGLHTDQLWNFTGVSAAGCNAVVHGTIVSDGLSGYVYVPEQVLDNLQMAIRSSYMHRSITLSVDRARVSTLTAQHSHYINLTIAGYYVKHSFVVLPLSSFARNASSTPYQGYNINVGR